jgi:tRNA U55 pseudouridine synthase TruB
MGELTRLRAGPFAIEDSITLAQLSQLVAENRLAEVLCKIEDVLAFPRVEAPEALEKPLRNGHAVELIETQFAPGDKVFLTLRGETAGIYIVTERDGRMCYKPAVMLITR